MIPLRPFFYVKEGGGSSFKREGELIENVVNRF